MIIFDVISYNSLRKKEILQILGLIKLALMFVKDDFFNL